MRRNRETGATRSAGAIPRRENDPGIAPASPSPEAVDPTTHGTPRGRPVPRHTGRAGREMSNDPNIFRDIALPLAQPERGVV
jgi:hypothetical protein